MKKMRIVCECTSSGRRQNKVISFPLTDEMSDHIKTLFTKRNAELQSGENNTDAEQGFVCEGNKLIKVYMSVVDADSKF